MRPKAKWLRYILRTPTEIYGHYISTHFSDLRMAKEKLVPGGFVLDKFQPIGYLSLKVVASIPRKD